MRPDPVEPLGHCKDFGLYSERGREQLGAIEQRQNLMLGVEYLGGLAEASDYCRNLGEVVGLSLKW